MDLPTSILVKSNINNKYLRYRKENDSSHGFLQFSQEEKDENVEFRCVKFEVEKAKTEGFIHIRSCYNNKYWVRNSSSDTHKSIIVAEANEPEEDQSKVSCTLFKPVVVEEDTCKSTHEITLTEPDGAADDQSQKYVPRNYKIRLIHVDQLGQHYSVSNSNSNSNSKSSTSAAAGDDDVLDLAININGDGVDVQDSELSELQVFTVYDARSYVILPDYVAFMGPNDLYCSITHHNSIDFLHFRTDDIGTWQATNSIIQRPLMQNISMRIEPTLENWRDFSGNVIAWHDNTVIDFFTPITLGGNVIALRSERSQRLLHLVSGTQIQNVLGSWGLSIDSSARFRVVEAVLFREIRNVVYNLNDSRIYNVTSVQKYRDIRRNFSSVEQSGAFHVSYTVTQTMSWNDSVTVARGLAASWSSSIPYVGSFGVELSVERTESREWGVEKVVEEQVAYEQSLTIPPGKQITLTVLATRASCDVPFTCDVRDTMTFGTMRPYTKTDGLFQGSNEFNFVTEITEQDI